MTPADFIEVLKDADEAEMAEIRRLLGVPDAHLYAGPMLIGPGQDDYGRIRDNAAYAEQSKASIKQWVEENAGRIVTITDPEPAPEPDSLDARNPLHRETV